jgi:hypothetical protein
LDEIVESSADCDMLAIPPSHHSTSYNITINISRYCCDVNGFSFVKNSRKYYDDASQVDPGPNTTQIPDFRLRFLFKKGD